MQWTPARQAVCVHFLMDAILLALLQNSKQCTLLLGQQYVSVEMLLKFLLWLNVAHNICM